MEGLHILRGDITRLPVDVIVNAASTRLDPCSGLSWAILKRGGPAVEEAVAQLGDIPLGEVRETVAGELPAKIILHAAVYDRESHQLTEGSLRAAARAALSLARAREFQSISLP